MEQAPLDTPALEPRSMALEDLPQVVRIERMSYPAPWSSSYFRQCILAGYECWVMERNGRIECYSILNFSGTTAHLLNLCVRQDSRGQGLGRRMLDRLLAVCQDRVAFVLLEVRPSNDPAINLYRSTGFREFGRRPGYYRDPDGREDALVMVRRFQV